MNQFFKFYSGRKELFHHLRISVKKYLYQIELVRPLIQTQRAFWHQMTKLKERLGKLQDLVTLAREAKGYFKKTKRHPQPRKDF